MRLIDAEPIEQKLYKIADQTLGKNPYEGIKIRAYRKLLDMVLSAPTVERR